MATHKYQRHQHNFHNKAADASESSAIFQNWAEGWVASRLRSPRAARQVQLAEWGLQRVKTH